MYIHEPEIKPNILIVDDIKANLFLIKVILKNLDVNLILAESGLEALSKIKDMEIAMALLDIHMPIMSGIELAEKIQNDYNRERIPIIYISAHYLKDEIELEKFYESGAIDFIQKPFSKSILISKVTVFLELYRQKQQIREQKRKIESTANELEKTNQSLSRRFAYEQLLSKISGMGVVVDDIGDFLVTCLSTTGETLDLSRFSIYEYKHETNTVNNAYEWCNVGIISHKSNFSGLWSSQISYWTEKSIRGQILNFSDIEDIPNEGIRSVLRMQNIQAILAIPLFINGNYYGYMEFSDCLKHREWTEEDVNFLLAISRIVAAVIERKHAEEELGNSHEQLHQLSKYIEKVREEERSAISKEIHDDLGQALSVVKIDLGIISQSAPSKEVEQRIFKTVALVSDTIKTVQKITFQLRPQIIDDLGLEAGIDWYTKEFSERNRIEIFLDIDSDIVIPSDISFVVFRIMQESLTNVSRHANARQINIQLSKDNNDIIFLITDNGIGISERQLKSKTSFGIIGMKERAISIGGSLDVYNHGLGTSTKLVLPLNEL
jgi:signal transduction histidine kinase/DNA-binding response OmpR family regulator